jgi:hypothetical protein
MHESVCSPSSIDLGSALSAIAFCDAAQVQVKPANKEFQILL